MKELTTRLRISLVDIEPRIWRRVEVPLAMKLDEVHEVIQVVMGWWDYHLHAFYIGKRTYGPSFPQDAFGDTEDESRVPLSWIVDHGIKKIRYVYDFGDYWVHEISIGVKRIGADDIDYPVFLGGENSSPPEDTGGPFGYYGYLEAISDPNHEEHEAMLEWNGADFDPTFVDETLIAEKIGAIATRRKGTDKS